MYSRKLFEATAKILREVREAGYDERTISEIEDKLLCLFVVNNPRFNPTRFIIASHPSKEENY